MNKRVLECSTMKSDSRMTGCFYALCAALLWGVSGTCAQFLFQHRGITPGWLVTIRLITAGLLLLVISAIRNRSSVISIWKVKKDCVHLISFGIFGMLAVQYTYFAAIKHSNAATATILQYLGPVFIACYYSLVEKRIPVKRELIAIVFALIGTFLIVTHGSLDSLSITDTALFWGLISAVALATYSIIPVGLLKKYEAPVIVGWGMLIGGIAFSFLYSPWDIPGTWDLYSYLNTIFIVIFGSAVAFISYLVSVRIIGATVASLLACIEPLSAALIAVMWLNVNFGVMDWLGTAFILITIALLTKKKD